MSALSWIVSRLRVSRGALRQTLLVGADFGTQRTDNVRSTAYFGPGGSTATSFAVPFDAPRVSAPVTFRQSATDADNRTTVTTRAVYAQDQIAIGPHAPPACSTVQLSKIACIVE